MENNNYTFVEGANYISNIFNNSIPLGLVLTSGKYKFIINTGNKIFYRNTRQFTDFSNK